MSKVNRHRWIANFVSFANKINSCSEICAIDNPLVTLDQVNPFPFGWPQEKRGASYNKSQCRAEWEEPQLKRRLLTLSFYLMKDSIFNYNLL